MVECENPIYRSLTICTLFFVILIAKKYFLIFINIITTSFILLHAIMTSIFKAHHFTLCTIILLLTSIPRFPDTLLKAHQLSLLNKYFKSSISFSFQSTTFSVPIHLHSVYFIGESSVIYFLHIFRPLVP